MDFLDPHKRRAHTIRLFIGYGLVGIALLIATGLLALYAYGYDFNRKTGSIVQNGLVFVDAHPESAYIYLNGEHKGQTGARLVLREGHYQIELRKKGYRTWQKDLDLNGSELARLVYPLLIPDKVITKDIDLFNVNPSFVASSPDRHWLVIQKPGSLTEYQVHDLTTSTNTSTVLSLAASLFSAGNGAHGFELVEWSSDNRRFLMRHDYGTGVEYILIDRETPSASQNLSRLLERSTARISLRDKKYDQYYIYEPGTLTLATAELSTRTVAPLLSGVLAFKPHGDNNLVYKTRSPSDQTKDNLVLRLAEKSYVLRELPRSDTHLIDIARFENRWYIVAASPTEGRSYVFRDPQNQAKRDPSKPPAPVAALRLDNPTALSFSTSSRFIAVQSGSMFAVYDNEDVRLLRFDTGLKLQPNAIAKWMDGHRLTVVSEEKLRVFEFDGANLQTLQATSQSSVVSFDKDYKASFTFGPSLTVPGKPALQRTELRVVN